MPSPRSKIIFVFFSGHKQQTVTKQTIYSKMLSRMMRVDREKWIIERLFWSSLIYARCVSSYWYCAELTVKLLSFPAQFFSFISRSLPFDLMNLIFHDLSKHSCRNGAYFIQYYSISKEWKIENWTIKKATFDDSIRIFLFRFSIFFLLLSVCNYTLNHHIRCFHTKNLPPSRINLPLWYRQHWLFLLLCRLFHFFIFFLFCHVQFTFLFRKFCMCCLLFTLFFNWTMETERDRERKKRHFDAAVPTIVHRFYFVCVCRVRCNFYCAWLCFM